MEDISSLNKIKEEDNLEIKHEEVDLQLSEDEENEYVCNEGVENIIKTEIVDGDDDEESYVPNEDFKQGLIKTENEFLPGRVEKNIISNKKTVNSSGLESHSEEDEVKNIKTEFSYVEANQEEAEWSEPSCIKADPLALDPTAVKIKVEPQFEEGKQYEETLTTDTPASLSHDTQFYPLYAEKEHFAQRDYFTTKKKPTVTHTKIKYKQCGGIIFDNAASQLCPVKIQKPYKCTVCDYSASQSNHLKVHMMAHTGERPHKCTVCDYSSVDLSSIKKHMRIHAGEQPYKCTFCDYSTTTSTSLKIHMRMHIRQRIFKCTVCDYWTTNSTSLKLHVRVQHTREKPYKCSLCDYRSTTKPLLKQHIMRVHTGERPFKCTVCDYCTTTSSLLKCHIRVHTGEKPYKCAACDFCTASSSSLRVHMSVHTGEKPYKCFVCDFCSATSSKLKLHMRIHSAV